MHFWQVFQIGVAVFVKICDNLRKVNIQFDIKMVSVILQSSDAVIYVVEMEVVENLGAIASLVESQLLLFPDQPVKCTVCSKLLTKMIEWVKLRKTEQPLVGGQEAPLWYKIFFNSMDFYTLMELSWHAGNIQMNELHQHACNIVKNLVEGKSTEEVYTLFYPDA